MKKLFKEDSGEEHNFWMSYTDLMSGFLVVFIILSAILYNYYTKKVEEAGISKEMYDDAIAKYDKALSELENSSRDIDSCLLENERLKAKIDSLIHNDMKNLVMEYNDFAGIKGDIKVVVNQTKGSIALYHKNNNELFITGKAEPLKALKEFLNNYGKNIIEKTMSLKQRHPNIELRIEGHTNPIGQQGQEYGGDASFVYNMSLSSQRANSVYSYLYNSKEVSLNEEEKTFLRNHAISVGYSFAERIKDGTHSSRHAYGHLDDLSKRIEFRIISK